MAHINIYNMSQEDKEILSPKQVEELLSISHSTRVDWTKKGYLNSYKIGERKLFYLKSEILNSLVKVERVCK